MHRTTASTRLWHLMGGLARVVNINNMMGLQQWVSACVPPHHSLSQCSYTSATIDKYSALDTLTIATGTWHVVDAALISPWGTGGGVFYGIPACTHVERTHLLSNEVTSLRLNIWRKEEIHFKFVLVVHVSQEIAVKNTIGLPRVFSS